VRIKAFIILGSFLFSIQVYSTVWASNIFEAQFFSRNMPVSCEFVFRVDSDLALVLPANSSEDHVFYQLQNSWVTSKWTNPVEIPLKHTDKGVQAKWSFQSMSIPENYLYRNIKLIFPNSKKTCYAEFGRQFGEACMSGGRDSTPWRERVLSCEDGIN
jgi:hypothetical protein